MTSSARQLVLLKGEHQADTWAGHLAKEGRMGMKRYILVEKYVGTRLRDQKGCYAPLHSQVN